jgi:16S rRNA (uracil1498-N3)-methyltransferase
MHRFYLPPDACASERLVLPEAEAHHAREVLRLRIGATVTVLNGAGAILDCAVARLDRRQVILEVRQRRSEPRLVPAVTLIQSVTKTRSMEWIVQKGTELGVRRLIPVLTERSVPQFTREEANRKVERWRDLAVESLKQCGTPWLSELPAPVPLDEYLAAPVAVDLAFVASLHPGAVAPKQVLEAFRRKHDRPPAEVAVWIGPEGDFTAGELEAIQATAAVPITLGPLVLRAETAAVYCLSFLGYELRA